MVLHCMTFLDRCPAVQCTLFSKTLAVNGKALEELCAQGGGTAAATIALCRHLDAAGRRFFSLSDLTAAVQRARLVASAHKRAIAAFLSVAAQRSALLRGSADAADTEQEASLLFAKGGVMMLPLMRVWSGVGSARSQQQHRRK